MRRALHTFQGKKSFRTVLLGTSFVAFLIAITLNILFSHRSLVLSAEDFERVDFVINRFLDLNTLSPTSDIHGLSSIVVRGQDLAGAGGPASCIPAGCRQHIVEAGQTLSEIAELYGLSSWDFAAVNTDLESREIIHPGQVLNIPADAANPAEVKRLMAQQKAKPGIFSADQSYGLPVNYSYKSQGFSPGSHPGLDMVANQGTPVRATKSGKIITADFGYNGGYGNLIIEDLGGGVTARYAHLSKFAKGIEYGIWVDKGEVIGYVGTTGRSTGPHLHFELRRNGVAFNPNM